MKANEIKELENFVSNKDLAQMFHVYVSEDSEGNKINVYNTMRTIYFSNIDNIPKSYFEYYKVMNNDSWNLISYKLYGTIELWWMIVKLNNIPDPTFEPEEDTYIRYITKEKVNQVLDLLRTN